jgi:hypothetical protein
VKVGDLVRRRFGGQLGIILKEDWDASDDAFLVLWTFGATDWYGPDDLEVISEGR